MKEHHETLQTSYEINGYVLPVWNCWRQYVQFYYRLLSILPLDIKLPRGGSISHQPIYLRHIIVPIKSQCLDFQRHMMLFLIMYNVLRLLFKCYYSFSWYWSNC